MNWNNKKVLVTGGASFIGSHLCEQLVNRGAKVRVAENFSSGERKHLDDIDCEILEGDLLSPEFCDQATKDMEVFFTWRRITEGVDTSIHTPWNAPQT